MGHCIETSSTTEIHSQALVKFKIIIMSKYYQRKKRIAKKHTYFRTKTFEFIRIETVHFYFKSISVVLRNLKQNLVHVIQCNDQFKTFLT